MGFQSQLRQNHSSDKQEQVSKPNIHTQSQTTQAAPSPFSRLQVAQLQKTIGNRAVTQLFQSHMQSTQALQKKENRTGMPDQLKSGVENLSGHSMDDVKVHYNSDKPAGLQALAYAQGNDIHVGPGQEQHLPHEAWHVVQQRQGRVVPTQLAAGVAINDEHGLESEADTMGAKAADFSGERMQLKQSDEASSEGSDSAASYDIVQRVAAPLFDGLDAESPSTYDVGGGHSYADHGAQTTEVQQRERLSSGTAPSGRVSNVPPGKAASKFASDDKHKEAFKQAYTAIVAKNKPKQNLVGMGSIIDVAGAGVGYFQDGSQVTCDKVQLDIQPSGGKIRINTMFPVS